MAKSRLNTRKTQHRRVAHRSSLLDLTELSTIVAHRSVACGGRGGRGFAMWVCTFLFSAAAALAADESSWPLFRGDSACTGVARTTLPETLQLQWTFRVPNGAFEGTATIAENRVFVADLDGKLHALSLDHGQLLWEFATEVGFSTAPSYLSGRLYLGDFDGVFYCVDAATGTLVWKFAAEGEIDSSANFHAGNVLFGSQDATLYCLDAIGGELRWKHQIDDQIRCTPAIAEGNAFVAGCDSKLHIVDLAHGSGVGSVPILAQTGVTPAVKGELAFLATEGGAIHAVDWKAKQVLWSYTDKQSTQAFRSSPALAEKLMIVGGSNKYVYALDQTTGDAAWKFRARKRVDSSPVVCGDRVFFGSADGRLYALDVRTGAKVWEYETGGSLSASPAVAAGRLVIASDDGVVYCFGSRG